MIEWRESGDASRNDGIEAEVYIIDLRRLPRRLTFARATLTICVRSRRERWNGKLLTSWRLFVSQRHEVPLINLHTRDIHTHRLLTEINSGERLSQRTLARRVGIALGLTNLLIRRFVRKGWVRVVQTNPNRVMYLLTPAGLAEKARMSRDSLQYSVRFYTDARQRIAARFAQLSDDWGEPSRVGKRIAFFGTGEVAEIGYVCLQETDLVLAGAVDDCGRRRFFDVPLYSRDWLRCDPYADGPFRWLIVMSFEHQAVISNDLDELGFPRQRVVWV